MATALRIPLEEYLRSHYEPECELIGGELFQKPRGTLEHMDMEDAVRQILKRFQEQGLGRVAHELSVRRGDEVRIPDVVFVAPNAKFQDGVLLDSPLLCVEILSPSQRPSELFAKCEAYYTWGVPYCWIIDPVKKLTWEYHQDSPVQLIPAKGSLQAGEIAVGCNELFG